VNESSVLMEEHHDGQSMKMSVSGGVFAHK